MSSYLDTGSVLIESACETERTDAVLATLTSLIPGLHYFRRGPCLPAPLAMEGTHKMTAAMPRWPSPPPSQPWPAALQTQPCPAGQPHQGTGWQA